MSRRFGEPSQCEEEVQVSQEALYVKILQKGCSLRIMFGTGKLEQFQNSRRLQRTLELLPYDVRVCEFAVPHDIKYTIFVQVLKSTSRGSNPDPDDTTNELLKDILTERALLKIPQSQHTQILLILNFKIGHNRHGQRVLTMSA